MDCATGTPATSCLDQREAAFPVALARAAWELVTPPVADPPLADPEFAVALESQFAVP